ncbi:MAG: YceI family protein [Bacteroidia bacterium]
MAKVNWIADAAHSEVGFRVKHLMITNVKGNFANYTANVTTEENDFGKAEINFSADTASITTGNEQRDGHLRSGDFFDSENHPHMTFRSTSVSGFDGSSDFQVHGDLTIRGQAHPVTLDVEFGGVAKDPWGNTKAGFTISGKINRKHWGLTWNAPTEAGGLLVSEDVKLHIDLQLLRQ